LPLLFWFLNQKFVCICFMHIFYMTYPNLCYFRFIPLKCDLKRQSQSFSHAIFFVLHRSRNRCIGFGGFIVVGNNLCCWDTCPSTLLFKGMYFKTGIM
jgi:hypothetical protein